MPLQAEFNAMAAWGVLLTSAFAIRYFGGNVPALQPVVSAAPLAFWSAFTVGTALFARYLAKGNPLPPSILNKDLSGKVICVTGPAAGLGLETSLFFAVRGATVILGARSEKRNEEAAAAIRARPEAKGKNLKFITKYAYDAEDLNSVKKFADDLLSEKGRLDYLCLNAGLFDALKIGKSKFHPHLEYTTCINHLAPILLAEKLLPKLKRDDTHVCYVASLAHTFIPRSSKKTVLEMFQVMSTNDEKKPFELKNTGFADSDRYAVTKLGNIYASHYLASQGVKSACCHPGFVASAFYDNIIPAALQPLVIGLGYYLAFKTQLEGNDSQTMALFNPDNENPKNFTLDKKVAESKGLSVTQESTYYVDAVRHNESSLMSWAKDLQIADDVMKWSKDQIKPYL